MIINVELHGSVYMVSYAALTSNNLQLMIYSIIYHVEALKITGFLYTI